MSGPWMDPVRRLCCTLGPSTQCPRGSKVGDAELLEESPSVQSSVAEILVGSRRFRGRLPAGPRDRIVPTYETAQHEALQGDPIYSGNILQLTLGESIHEMKLALYVNGFSLSPVDSSAQGSVQPISRGWSPFSLVEKCQVKTMQHSAYWAVFKLTVFRREGQDRCYYFATTGGDAYKERDRWVVEMVTAVSNVTMSLFPKHAITVQPIPGVTTTSTRIMAGYLLQSGAADSVSLFYCELHAYSGGEARLAIYKDEWCTEEVTNVLLADTSTVSTRKGAYCTVFGVDAHRFCARSRDEKDLWLRAISNIKVKLMFDAPDPTDEELAVFRASVHERIEELHSAGGATDSAYTPLLTQVVRAPPTRPRGDAWDPDPIDDGSDEQAAPDISPIGEDDTCECVRVDTLRLHRGEDDTVKGLEPEECRRLLRSAVPAKISMPGASQNPAVPGATSNGEQVNSEMAAPDMRVKEGTLYV